jgi:hypothetical protein
MTKAGILEGWNGGRMGEKGDSKPEYAGSFSPHFSIHQGSAVNIQNLAGNERCLLRSKE